MKSEDYAKIKKGAKVKFGQHEGVLKNVYLSPGGLVLQVQTVPGSIVCCNVPVANVDNIEEKAN